MTDYPKIEIIDKSHGVNDRKPAFKISNRLAVSWSNKNYDNDTYKIFSIVSYMPFINCRFESMNDAIESAELLEEIYSEFLDILEADPNIDIIAVTQWSIPNGIKIYENLQGLEEKDLITLEDMKRALEVVK